MVQCLFTCLFAFALSATFSGMDSQQGVLISTC